MNFKIFNQADYSEIENGWIIYAKPMSDMIADPQTKKVISNASFIAEETEGDFTLSAKVSHDFLSLYDAACLIAYANDTLWGKVCFECSEKNAHTVVSVMTDGLSDDANSVVISGNEVWLQLSRKGNNFAVHYSTDGKDWNFVRVLHMNLPKTMFVGFLAQSPLGEGGEFRFENVIFKHTAPDNLRTGI